MPGRDNSVFALSAVAPASTVQNIVKPAKVYNSNPTLKPSLLGFGMTAQTNPVGEATTPDLVRVESEDPNAPKPWHKPGGVPPLPKSDPEIVLIEQVDDYSDAWKSQNIFEKLKKNLFLIIGIIILIFYYGRNNVRN